MIDHDSALCASVGHVYIESWAVFCRHRQAWVVTSSAYVDDGTSDGPRLLETRRMELGPFDGTAEALQQLHQGLDDAANVVQSHTES